MGKTNKTLHIIGAGLAGSEAAWQAAEAGVTVILHEMRPSVKTEVHETGGFAELVCSNSFRSDDHENNAVGVLHEEMRILNSLIMAAGDAARVPAGSALAVDRDDFSGYVTEKLEGHPRITTRRSEVAGLPPAEWSHVIIATGPLTSPALSQAILSLTGEDELAFFDAIAPIVTKESINFDVAWFQSRYDKGAKEDGQSADYINCPMDKDQYYAFIQGLLDAEKMDFKDWEKSTPYFEGCMPIEVMAERGPQTLSFGPMKPVGLMDPRTGKQAYAVVQLRQDNKLGTLYNMVGFQTKMKYGAQVALFRTIPGLEKAEFARLGGLHRNTFINSPKLLDKELRLKTEKRLRFAGQITGVEGYIESAAMGLLAGRFAAAEILGEAIDPPPDVSAHGALLEHITGGHLSAKGSFQPMNITFGLMPDLGERLRKADRKPAKAKRALEALREWAAGN